MITQLRQALLGCTLSLALIPAASFAQDANSSATPAPAPSTPTKAKSKKKKAKKSSTSTNAAAPADSSAADTPLSKLAPSAPPPAPSNGVRLAPGEVLNFNTEGSADKPQSAPVFTFKDSSEPMAAPIVYNDAVPDDTPFKTYVGYPKHRFSLSGAPEGIAAVWNYNGGDIDFRTNATAFGIGYELVATPRFAMGIDYSHATMKADAASVQIGSTPFKVASSSTNLDPYLIHAKYCFFGAGNFNVQYCPGFLVGNDAYPILAFTDSSHLKMSNVQDIVVGLNFRVQFPISDRFIIHLTPGYNMGTGIGNSGTLTSKNNSTAYGLLGARYEFNVHHALGIDGDMALRNAKLKGKVGNNDDTWTTMSTEVGGRVTYTFTL